METLQALNEYFLSNDTRIVALYVTIFTLTLVLIYLNPTKKFPAIASTALMFFFVGPVLLAGLLAVAITFTLANAKTATDKEPKQ